MKSDTEIDQVWVPSAILGLIREAHEEGIQLCLSTLQVGDISVLNPSELVATADSVARMIDEASAKLEAANQAIVEAAEIMMDQQSQIEELEDESARRLDMMASLIKQIDTGEIDSALTDMLSEEV